MDYRFKLCFCRDIYDHKQNNRAFMEAVRRNVDCHLLKCEDYRRILESRGFSREDGKRVTDAGEVPCIPTLFFKYHDLHSMPESAMVVKATSSGTKGVKSHIGFDKKSLFFGGIAACRVIARHGLFSMRPARYVILGFPPGKDNQTAISKTQRLSTMFAPALSRRYALRKGKNGYRPDFKGLMAALRRYSGGRAPVRIIGFPAYLYFLLKEMERREIFLRLPRHSMIMVGGGWKQFYKETVDKAELYQLCERHLGVPESHFREFFGAVEHPGVYCDCPNHHFHVPATSRVVIRDVDTLEPVGYGKAGLVNLISPLAESIPLVSILTDDLGVLHRGCECGCGMEAPYLEIIGRTGVPDIRTCAAGAGELLKEVGRSAFH